MSFSILVVDDEPDIAEMFRRRFRREVRQGTYVLHFAMSGEEALGTAPIFTCRGTIDKYIGDEIFAVFGVPVASPDDAANALRCADMMLEALECWNAKRRARGERHLAIGIGPQLRAGGAGRYRQRAQFFIHGDRRHSEHGKSVAKTDP